MSQLITTTNAKFGNEPLTVDPEAIETVQPHKAGASVQLRSGERLIVGENYESFRAKWAAALGGE